MTEKTLEGQTEFEREIERIDRENPFRGSNLDEFGAHIRDLTRKKLAAARRINARVRNIDGDGI